MKAQYGILRFKKYKGPAISPIEAHNERTKEQYASNPDIDTSRSRYNLHLVQPQGKYREEADRMIAAAHCRVRKDSVRVVEALVTASPEFFKDKTNREIRAYFAYALKFLEDRQRPDTFLSAVVHMDEKTPHLHLCFVPLTADGRLSAKEIIGNRKNLVRWQDEFWQHMVKQYPELERGESASQTGREHIPPRIFKEMTQLTKQKEQLDALLVGINPFNGKSRAAEISKVLDSYIPNVGGPGAALSHAVLNPSRRTVTEGSRGEGNIVWQRENFRAAGQQNVLSALSGLVSEGHAGGYALRGSLHFMPELARPLP